MIPDRVDGPANGRDVLAMREHRISLCGNPHASKFAGQIGKVGDLDAGDVIEIPGIVAIAADAVGHFSHPVRDITNLLVKALPLAGNGGAALAAVTLADTGDEQGLAG